VVAQVALVALVARESKARLVKMGSQDGMGSMELMAQEGTLAKWDQLATLVIR